MNPFTTIEDAFEFVKRASLAGDSFELPMSEGYTVGGKPDRPLGKFSLGMAQIVAFLVSRDFEPSGSEQQRGFTVFRFSRMRMSSASDIPFPPDFSTQRIRLANAHQLAVRPPTEIVAYFKEHPQDASDVMGESADKRYMPSTFVEKVRNGGYRVGWMSYAGMQCVQTFRNREDAVTDYLLFSLGKGRWNGHPATA